MSAKDDYIMSLNITPSVRLEWAMKEIERLKLTILELEKIIDILKNN